MIVALLLTAVDRASFSRTFYANSYRELNTAAEIGISQSDLDLATEQLLDYIQGQAPNLAIDVRLLTLEGQPNEPMFNQREIDHMADVRALYLSAMIVRDGLLLSALVIGLWLLVLARKNKTKNDYKNIRQGLLTALFVFLLILGSLGLYAALDFNSFWTRFHLIFFSNDLWILNPLTDRLIMMVPSAFFCALIRNIIFTTLTVLFLYNVLLFTLCHALERRQMMSKKL